ncbi:MAG TPA: anthranilate synthase component I family protein [Actinomycetes bacterium]|nr:anthranilate synthase component I family protein [Actinomycetes bacterium]
MAPRRSEPLAHLGGRLATGLTELSDDLGVLDRSGWWAVVVDFEGSVTCARFADVRPAPLPPPAGSWCGPGPGAWTSSLTHEEYVAAVVTLREAIAAGTVYQANVCRVLRAEVDPSSDGLGLAHAVARGNPAPHGGFLRLPGLDVASASPETYLRRDDDLLTSRPIKGTGRIAPELSSKDEAENVMIVDLVRNDLGRVSRTGTVDVPDLLAVERHPGLVHLVSTVTGRLRPDVGWAEIFAATFPPGSVTGAPKSSALRLIGELENGPRGVYCGAVGWVDADRRTADLAVAIRTFSLRDGILAFGTGAGITWGSDPEAEWRETELKAARLLALAGGADVKDVEEP